MQQGGGGEGCRALSRVTWRSPALERQASTEGNQEVYRLECGVCGTSILRIMPSQLVLSGAGCSARPADAGVAWAHDTVQPTAAERETSSNLAVTSFEFQLISLSFCPKPPKRKSSKSPEKKIKYISKKFQVLGNFIPVSSRLKQNALELRLIVIEQLFH